MPKVNDKMWICPTCGEEKYYCPQCGNRNTAESYLSPSEQYCSTCEDFFPTPEK